MPDQPTDDAPTRWFLDVLGRGNPHTGIDEHHGDGRAYTVGNRVAVLIDGDSYFRRLFDVFNSLTRGDRVLLTDWRGDADERLHRDTEIGSILASLARRGVAINGLVWRSHFDRTRFSEKQNRNISRQVNEAGGEMLLDERVRALGSHHQKVVVVERADGSDSAFVGGIDLCHGRHDSAAHHGDPQRIELDDRYGPRPAWHDAQLEIEGPAVDDVSFTFRERWNDPTPLDHHVLWRMLLARLAHEPRRWSPLPPRAPALAVLPRTRGAHAVQLLRTYPSKRRPYPFAPDGERSVARAYLKAFARARSLVYIEDQYLWSFEAVQALASALRRAPDLHVVAVVPAFPDRDSLASGPPSRLAQRRAIEQMRAAGPGRVAVYALESASGLPIYVHAKVCVVDDIWMTIGSDNLNRRSWTNDSELSCAVIDATRDERQPIDPAGLGDGARVLARDTRLALWREHLGIDDEDDELVDPRRGFARLARTADALDAWHRNGCIGPRPPGRLRHHEPQPVAAIARPLARVVYRVVVDPDGRPRRLRRARRF